jgi:hypothetical protein
MLSMSLSLLSTCPSPFSLPLFLLVSTSFFAFPLFHLFCPWCLWLPYANLLTGFLTPWTLCTICCPCALTLAPSDLFLGSNFWFLPPHFHPNSECSHQPLLWPLGPRSCLILWLITFPPCQTYLRPSFCMLHPFTAAYIPQNCHLKELPPPCQQQLRIEAYSLKQCQHHSVSYLVEDTGCGLLA